MLPPVFQRGVIGLTVREIAAWHESALRLSISFQVDPLTRTSTRCEAQKH